MTATETPAESIKEYRAKLVDERRRLIIEELQGVLSKSSGAVFSAGKAAGIKSHGIVTAIQQSIEALDRAIADEENLAAHHPK